MKFSLSNLFKSRPNFVCQKMLISSVAKTLNPSSHSLTTARQLYRRISPIGDPSISVVPVLDQWLQEGNSIGKEELHYIIHELKNYRRFTHALEISLWMTDKRYFPVSSSDAATRINLIYRVHGLKQVEKYFENIPQQLKGFNVWTSLLNCYAREKCVEKAEGIMQKLRDMGYAGTPLGYNILMNLYYQMGSWEKLDKLMQEMKEKSIPYNNYTFGIRLSAYAAAADKEGIDKIVTMMESDPRSIMNYNTYAVAAKGYLKVGLVNKAVVMLKGFERCITASKSMSVGLESLLRLYAETGKKDELYRIWNVYKNDKIFNRTYISMMSSLSKFNDIEGAEKILEEWERSGLSYDFRIPNFLIDAYCRNNQLEKAEALLNRGLERGGTPTVNTWCYMAGAYIEHNQYPEAVEALKKSVSMCPPSWKPQKDTLVRCLEHLEGQGDMEDAADILRLLRV